MTLVVVLPTAAHAELDTPISGNTGSNSTVFYLSANFRQITDDLDYLGQIGYVHINIDSAPKLSNGSPDGLKWRLRKAMALTRKWSILTRIPQRGSI
jgi:hypothetical protein